MVTRPAVYRMEQVFVVARSSFVNSRFGSVTRKQRIPLPATVALELESMGLVSIEKQRPTVLKPAATVPQGAGQAVPSSASQAGQASETTSSPPRKSGKAKKAGVS